MTNRSVEARLLRIAVLIALFGAGCATTPVVTRPQTVSDCVRGALGIEPVDISHAFRETRRLSPDLRGAVVETVLPGSPAKSAGVLEGDVMVRVGSKEITNACEAIDELFGTTCAPVRIVVLRGGVNVDVTVTPVDAKEFLSSACDGGAEAACFRLAWMMWGGSGVARDRNKARSMYEKACANGAAEACAYLGWHMMDERAPADDVVRVLSRACDLGSGAGCAHLGYMYATGTLVALDDARSTPLYVRACDLGDARGCFNVGVMYRDGRGVERDPRRAITAYQEGCRGGSSTACTDLGWYYQYGEGVEKDEAQAVEYFRRGCEGTSCQPSNRRGCVNLGLAYKDGIGVEKNAERATEILQAACEDEIDSDDVNPSSNRAHACSLLGSMYLVGGTLEVDNRRGLDYSVLGCDGHDAFGCFNAAGVFAVGMGLEVDMIEAARYYQLACDFDDEEGCDALGRLYVSGSGVEKDLERAKQLFEKACAGGFREACGRARNP